MNFEWDENKSKKNIEKHDIDFNDARNVFYSPMLIRDDTRKEYNEVRKIGIGEIEKICIVIIFTFRKDKIRIISARKANKTEREVFYEKIGKNKLG